MRTVTKGLVVAIAFGLPGAAAAQEQEWGSNGEAGERPAVWLERDAEITLAQSAAPWDVAEEAAIYALGRWGYELVREGGNGFTCYVDRGADGQSLLPTCHDWGGTATAFEMAQKREKLRSEGMTQAEILSSIAWGFMDGSLRAPRSGSVTYRLSTEGYWHNPDGDNWAADPVVLLHTPYAGHAALGYDDDEGREARWSGLPYLTSEGGPMSAIVIPLDAWADERATGQSGGTGL